MSRIRSLFIPAIAWLALTCPSLSAAIDGRGVTPIQFSLWHPAAIFGDEWAVAGLRFNLAYTVCRDLYGLDINTGYAVVEGNFYGISAGIWHSVEGDYAAASSYGLQLGLANEVEGGFKGLQAGLYSKVRNVKDTADVAFQFGAFANRQEGGRAGGMQVGLINLADDFIGLRCGIGNIGTLAGLQVGLGNGESPGRERVTLVGGQVAGIYNLHREATGLSIAGIVNFVREEMIGWQLAGVVNIGQSASGVQLAGLVNVSGDFEGVQIGGLLNYAKKMKGVQIGAINFADRLAGLQLGAINVHAQGKVPFLPVFNFGWTF